MRAQGMRSIDLKTSFLRLLLPVLALYSFIVTSVFVWHDFRINVESRKQSQQLIFETFYSSIRQPLLQGSTIEAEIRAQELMKNAQVLCVDIQFQSRLIVQCKRDLAQFTTNVVASKFSFASGSNESFAELKVTFDNSDLKRESWRKLATFAGAFFCLGFLLFLILSFGFDRIRIELSKVLSQAQGTDKESHESGFRFTEFRSLSEKLNMHMRLAAESAEIKAALEISQQVAHDIRSPLAALKAMVKSATGRLDATSADTLRFAVQRIVDVSNDLARKREPDTSWKGVARTSVSVVNLDISEILSEKRLQYPESFVSFVEESEFSPVMVGQVSGSDFRRILSNLLDNAVQALAGKGRISISATRMSEEMCEVRITDDGIGISAEVLPKLFARGATFGKPGGKGLGLFWSKEVLQRMGGDIRIESVKNRGTTVVVNVPIEGGESWCAASLTLKQGMVIAVIDDDRCIFQAWHHRLENIDCRLVYHDGNADLSRLVREADLCLFDFDLGRGKPTGLRLIEELGCSKKSVLVTSQYEVEDVQKSASRLGIKILPKALIESIEIKLCPELMPSPVSPAFRL